MTEPNLTTRDRLLLTAMRLFWGKGIWLHQRRRRIGRGAGEQRQPLPLFPRQAGSAAGGAGGLQTRHRADAAGACMGGSRRFHRTGVRAAGALPREHRADRLACTDARSVRSPWKSTSPIRPCAKRSPTTSMHGSTRLRNAWSPRARDCRRNSIGAELAEFVLTTMEGGVMQSRTHRDVAYFDNAVRQLRFYFDCLEQQAKAKRSKPATRTRAAKKRAG